MGRSSASAPTSRSYKVRNRGPCLRSLNELDRDFEWRKRGERFRTLEELTEDFERRKALRASSAAATPPAYGREQLLSVLAAMPKDLSETGLGICCLSQVPPPAGSSRCLDADSSTCSPTSCTAADSSSAADAGADTRASGAKLVGEEAEGCPSTASGGEPSEGGSLDSEEPRLAETAMWESLSGEGAGWEKMPLGMRYSELWYPDWGYWDPASEQSWCVDCGYANPEFMACDYSSFLGGVDLLPEPHWSETHHAVEA